MASSSPVPAKSHALHNFKLPQLNWYSNHASNHNRRRRSTSSPPANSMARRQRRLSQLFASAAPRQPPLHRSVSESESSDNEKNSSPEISKARVSDNFPDRKAGKSIGKSEGSDAGGSGLKKGKTKMHIRFGSEDKHEDHIEGRGKTGTEEGELEEAKTWNLRPRKPLYKQPNANAGTPKAGGSAASPVQVESAKPPSGGGADEAAAGEEKKQKMMIPKFSLTLTRREIEEDIYAMTRTTPARRPQERDKLVQKQLDVG